MAEESIVKTAALVILSAMMFTFAYLFYLGGESFIPLILLFIGVVMALTLTSSFVRSHSK